MSNSRDWSQLPGELIEFISTRIITADDYLRFRAVCSIWRSSSSPVPRYLPPQFPWLLLPDPNLETDKRSFFSISDGKLFTFNLPEAEGWRCCGSSHGWLVLGKDKLFSLFNPITRARIELPPSTSSTILNVPAPELGHPMQLQRIMEIDGFIARKAMISTNPSLNLNDTFVMVIHRWGLYWAFCRVGGDSWTLVHRRHQITDVAYYNGKFYSLSKSGEITVYSIGSTSTASITASLPSHDDSSFALSSSPELLILTWKYDLRNTNEGYTIYKLDLGDGEQTWQVTRTIGDDMLFWDENTCLAFPVSNFDAWKSNQLCHPTFCDVQRGEGGESWNYGLVLLDITNGCSMRLPCNLGPVFLNQPAPMSFSPSLF